MKCPSALPTAAFTTLGSQIHSNIISLSHYIDGDE